MNQHNYIANRPWFSNVLRVLICAVLALLILVVVRQCQDCRLAEEVCKMVHDRTGYDPTIDNMDSIPHIVPPYDDDDTTSLPESVMLEHLFPPIGDQGQFGTCVAWAVAYNLKTALDAQKLFWGQAELAQSTNQRSPADLWYAMPSYSKGPNCSGTGFEAAFKVLQQNGVANMQSVPYDVHFNPCANVTALGDTLHRIANYSLVQKSDGKVPSVTQLKHFLADSIPLVMGAKLGDNFMQCSNDKVLRNETYRYTGMHAYHAICIVGYDDSRQAFRLRNTWGAEWGDKGSIWVDYNLLCNSMCQNIIVANNK